MKKILLLPTLAVASLLMVSCGGLTPNLPTKTTTSGTTTSSTITTTTPMTTTTTPVTSSTTTNPVLQTTTTPLTSTTTTTTVTTTDEGYEKKLVVYAGVSNRMRDILTILEAGFELEYPGWDVEIVSSYSPMSVNQDIKSIIVNEEESLPNIAYSYLEHVQDYVKTGKLLDLTPYITSTDDISYYNASNVLTELEGTIGLDTDDFAGQSLLSGYATNFQDYQKYGYNEDSLLAMPLCVSTDVLYYNKTVFDELNLRVPTTWDELWSIARLLKEVYPESIPFGFDSMSNFISNVCYQNDIDYVSSTKPYARFNNDKFKTYFNDLKSKYNDGLFTTQEIYGSYLSNLFTGSDNRMFMYYGSLAGAPYNTTSDFEVGVSKSIGSKINNKAVYKSLIQGPNLCAFDSGNEEVNKMAWLFMKELYDADIQAMYSIASGYAPVIKSAYQSELMSALYEQDTILVKVFKASEAMLDSYYSSPSFDNKTDLLSDLETEINKLLNGNITLDKAIEDTIEKYFPAPISLKRTVNASSNFKTDGIAYATLTSVVDGDDITVVSSSNSLAIRLMGVDTPEVGEALATDAKNYVKGLLDSATSIVIDANTKYASLDSTGERYLAYVWFKTAGDTQYRNLNLELVENGFSRSRISAGDSFYKYFIEAEKAAKENKVGIWNL